MNEAGEIEAERREPTDNLGEIAEEYAGGKAAIEATATTTTSSAPMAFDLGPRSGVLQSEF